MKGRGSRVKGQGKRVKGRGKLKAYFLDFLHPFFGDAEVPNLDLAVAVDVASYKVIGLVFQQFLCFFQSILAVRTRL